ncbi:MAG: DinB family protein [Actinomycetota bacterium]
MGRGYAAGRTSPETRYSVRMSIDFARVRSREATLTGAVAGLTPQDLARETEESIARMEVLLGEACDADVTFVPQDAAAADHAAEDPEEVSLAWTLAHLIVHCTASSEESAALAAEMARGVAMHGRSRWEVPWRSVTTLAQCRERLAESRRIRLASLHMWPDAAPDDIDPSPTIPSRLAAKERFARGLAHEVGHLEQIRDVLGQAKAARGA